VPKPFDTVPFVALAGWLGLAAPALAQAPSEPAPALASVARAEAAPVDSPDAPASTLAAPGPSPAPAGASAGHSVQAGVGVANNDIPVTELGYLLHLRRLKLGVVGQLGILRYASIGGTIAESGVRLRGRLPVWLRLAGQGRSATALTLDAGLQATVRVGRRVTLATAVILPVAVDVAPTPELARFPGLTLGAGAWVSASPRVSIGVQGFASAPEGYGGDSEKSALEASLGVRVRLGDLRRADDAAPLLNTSI